MTKLITLEAEVKKRLQAQADKAGRSLKAHIEYILEKRSKKTG